jgi:beta-N-acetylhexosaminidase
MKTDRDVLRDVGQLCWIGFEGVELDADLEGRLADGEAGAVVLFKRNLVVENAGGSDARIDVEALAGLNQALHAAGARSGDPLFIAVDQEGGLVQRVREPATRWPPMIAFDGVAEPRATSLARLVGAAPHPPAPSRTRGRR